MANEIKISLNATCTNGNYSDSWRASGLSLTQNILGASKGIADTTTSAMNIDYGQISTANAGLLFLQNLDGTNSVDVGITVSAVFYAFGRLLPTEHAMIRVSPGVQVQLKAVASTPQVAFWLLEQ